MMTGCRLLTCLLVALCLVSRAPQAVPAAEADPFGQAGAAAAPKGKAKAKPKAKAADAGDPFGGGEEGEAKPKPKAAKPAARPAPAAVSKPGAVPDAVPEAPMAEDTAVQALLDTRPSTPLEWTQVAGTLARLERFTLARQFLQKTLDAKLDAPALDQLGRELGTAAVVELGRNELAPEGRQLSDAILKAMESQARQPQHLAALVKLLQDPSADTRYKALLALQQARGAAVGPLLAVLADPARAAEYPNVRAALGRLGADAIRPLVGVLETGSPKLKIEALAALGQLEAKGSVAFLLAPYASPQSPAEVQAAAAAVLKQLFGLTPARDEAARLVAEQARQFFDSRRLAREDLPGQVEVWTWDEPNRQFLVKAYSVEDAGRILAARLAREAFAIAPQDPAIRRLYLATLLERASFEAGLEKPLQRAPGTPAAEAAAQGPAVLEEVLEYGMAEGHLAAATAAARLLGQVGTPESLLYRAAGPAPLVRALRHADSRLRFAAVEAVLALGATRPFHGCSYVPEALGFFAASQGMRRILVADPSTSEGRRLSGFFAAMGYQTDTAATGREVVQVALKSPDYEIILLDSGIDRPTVEFVLQQLRKDFRTGSVPVGIMARNGRLERAEKLAQGDRLATAFPRLHAAESVRTEIQRLLALGGRRAATAPERQQQAAAAVRWLNGLAADRNTIYDLGRLEGVMLAALNDPALSPQAAGVLAVQGTPDGQQALVELASRATAPLAVRKAALAAFRESTEKHGILLTTAQITLQYQRYNQSQSLDPATQQVLGLILDTLEAPSRPAQDASSAPAAPGKDQARARKG